MATEKDVYEIVLESNVEWVDRQFREAANQVRYLGLMADQASDAVRKGAGKIDADAQKIKRGFSGAFSGGQQLAFILDDLQYVGEQGMRPLLNNLSVISPALFGVGLAADILWRHWDSLAGKLGDTAPIKSAAEELKKLEQQTKRTADEERRLYELRAQAEAARAITTPADPEQERRSSAAVKALQSDPALNRAVLDVLMARNGLGAGPTAEERERARRAGIRVTPGSVGGAGGGGTFDEAQAQATLDRLVRERRAKEEQAAIEELAKLTRTPEGQAQIAGMLGPAMADRFRLAIEGRPLPTGDQFGPGRAEAEAEIARRAAEQRMLGLDAASYGPDRSTLERAMAEQDRRAAELARPLQGRYDLMATGGRVATREQVIGELTRSGVGTEEAGQLADSVLRELQQRFEQRVQSTALEQGVSPEEAERRIGLQARLERRAELLGRARDQLGDQMAMRRTNRPSQVMDATSFATALQTAVGGTNYQQQQIQRLDTLIKVTQEQTRELRAAGRF